jgi:hypothetical protein
MEINGLDFNGSRAAEYNAVGGIGLEMNEARGVGGDGLHRVGERKIRDAHQV